MLRLAMILHIFMGQPLAGGGVVAALVRGGHGGCVLFVAYDQGERVAT